MSRRLAKSLRKDARCLACRWPLVLAVAFLTPSPLVAQSPRPADSLERLPPVEPAPRLTLADLENLALTHNPTVARAAAHLEAARGQWLQVGLYPNPQVGVGQQQTGSQGLAEQDGAMFSQEFVLGRKLGLNRAIAEQSIRAAEHQVAAQRLRVLTDARIAFYHVLVAQRRQRLAAELVQIAQRGVEAARERDKGSDVGQNDVLEASIELHKAEIDAQKARYRHSAAWRAMTAVIGICDFPWQELEGPQQELPPSHTWEGVLHSTLQQSPEIAAAYANRQRAVASLQRAGVEAIPNVTFDGLVIWRDNGIGGRPDGGFLVSIPLPVWNRNQGGVAQARAEIVGAERALERLELDLQYRLAPIFERYENARFQVRQYRQLIHPAAASALALTRKNYEGGLVEYDDLLTSQRTNAQANLDFLDALGELWAAEAELCGMTLTGSLATSPD